jgi:DNA replication protein DnaC
LKAQNAAKFPAVKSLESVDFDALPDLNKKLVPDLARGEFVARHENVIALGPSGTGKTHVTSGIGLAACQRGIKTRFTTAAAFANVARTIGAPWLTARDDRGWALIRTGESCRAKPG